MMAAIRFGADNVFRSEESTITDEDIDVILARGEAKTKELADKIQKAEKGDLLDFRLDAGIAAQTFEGIDYSDKELRNQLRLLAHDSLGKRERRPPPTNYNPIMAPKKSMIVNNQRIKLPKCLRLPQMEDHHFYNRERLSSWANSSLRIMRYSVRLDNYHPGSSLNSSGRCWTRNWHKRRQNFSMKDTESGPVRSTFILSKQPPSTVATDIASIAADMDMSEEAVAEYSNAFWQYGPRELKKDEWNGLQQY
jgi:hypothetical protein